MDREEGALINYYEVLSVAEDATSAEIGVALERYRDSMTRQLNRPRTMQSARYALENIVPAIQRHLLSSEKARREYDAMLAD